MEYKLSEQELKDLMHRTWLKSKNFYSDYTDEYFYDYFEREKKQLTIQDVRHCSLIDQYKLFETGFKAYRHNVAKSNHEYDESAKSTCEIEFQKYRNEIRFNNA